MVGYHTLMTRMIFASICFASSFSAAKNRGWHLVNTTQTPVSVAWYTTKLGPRKSQSMTTMLRYTDPIIIDSEASTFLDAPHSPSSDVRLQLVITQSPALLRSSLEEREGLFICDGTSHELLQKPLLKHLPSNPKLYLGQPRGSTQLILRASTKPLTYESHFEPGWTFCNCAQKPLYAGWYEVSWDAKKRSYSEPSLGKNQAIFTLPPGKPVPISHPPLYDKKRQWKFCMSFDPALLSKKIDDLSKLTNKSIDELGSYETPWQVFLEENLPALVPHTHLIQVTNTTNNILYCALYYVDATGATKYGPRELVGEILPQLSGELAFPPRQWWRTTKLIIAREDQKHLLYERFLSPDQLKQLHTKDFQKSNYANWYIEGAFALEPHYTDPSRIHVSSIGGGLIERLARKAIDMNSFKGSRIKKYEEAFKRKDPSYLPDVDIQAAQNKPSVLTDPAQKHMEDTFIAQRSEIVRVALNKLLGEEVIPQGSAVPKIALVFTGGGYRAMIETIGFLEGASSKQSGDVFDCCLYLAGLSGSTWAINGLVASGLSPHGFAKHQKYKVGEGGLLSLKKLMSNLIEQSRTYPQQRFIESRYNKFHGPVGLYGHALAHALLQGFEINGRDAHTMKLSDLRSNLSKAHYPLPLSVAVDPGSCDKERVWYEFSPFYCGTYQEQGSWVDTKLLGCSFHDGRPFHIVPEYPLAHYMGIWGSAFALSSEDIEKASSFGGFLSRSINHMSSGFSKAYALLFSETPDITLAHGRITAGTLPNYNYQRREALEGIAAKPFLHFIDAGITMEGKERHNFATIPALWRDVDLVIMCDCTECPNSDPHSEHLLAADEEARRQRLPFPSLTRSTRHAATLKTMNSDIASLFVEDNAPIVVYMKAKKNKRYNGYLAGRPGPFSTGFDPDASITSCTSTTNFSYTPEEYDVLKGLTKSIFIQSKEVIKKAINQTLKRSGYKVPQEK